MRKHTLKLLMAIISIITCLLTIKFPYVSLIFLVALISLFFLKLKYEKSLYIVYLGMLCSSFFGPYLSLPGLENIFLFRILLMAHLFLFLFSKKDVHQLVKMKIPIIIMIIWWGYTIFTLLWASNIQLGLIAIYYQTESLYLIFLCVYYNNSYARFTVFSRVMLLCYTVSIAYGLYEVWTGNHGQFSAEVYLNYTDYRPTGFMMNLNDYASFVVIYFTIGLSAIPRNNKFIYYMSVGLLTVACYYLVIQTDSRTGFIGMVVVSLLLYFRKINIQKIYISVIGVLSTILMLLIYSDSLSSSSGLLNKIQTSFSRKVKSTDDRMGIYNYVWELINDHSFLGVGIGNTPKYVYKFLYGTTNIPLDDKMTMGVHNYWLSSLSDIGLLGFACTISLFIYILVKSIKYYITSVKIANMLPLMVFIGFMAVSIGSSSIFEMRVVWVALGAGLSIIVLLNNEKSEGTKFEKKTSEIILPMEK